MIVKRAADAPPRVRGGAPVSAAVCPPASGAVSFGLGLVGASAAAVAVLLVMLLAGALTPAGAVSASMLEWLRGNLGWSAPLFAGLLALFAFTLGGLHERLARRAPAEHVAQFDHLSDLWVNLFFGAGVIWTAIGMRGALLYSLGDTQRLARDGAFEVLERMVEGGILLALSTTIVGGAGGYLMRMVKATLLGPALRSCYASAARHDGMAIARSLQNIEARLEARGPSRGSSAGDDRLRGAATSEGRR